MPIDRRRVKRERPPVDPASGFWLLEEPKEPRTPPLSVNYPPDRYYSRDSRRRVSLDSPDPSGQDRQSRSGLGDRLFSCPDRLARSGTTK